MDPIVKRFEAMGARAVVRPPRPPRSRWHHPEVQAGGVRLDVLTDRKGEYFEVVADRGVELHVLDLQPRERHLLLMSRNGKTAAKDKFLCGHDERHWFVAAVPPGRASNVATAFDALKPVQVRVEEGRRRVRRKERNRRRNAAFVRQGEWFFVPAGDLAIDPRDVLRNEPLRRGNGKPHVVEFVARIGGEQVWVHRRHPNGLTYDAYQALLAKQPNARHWPWQVMQRDALVYAKGRVRHADHATIMLPGWHRVIMNRENEAPAMRHVAFLD